MNDTDPENPTDEELSATIKCSLRDGTLTGAGAWLNKQEQADGWTSKESM